MNLTINVKTKNWPDDEQLQICATLNPLEIQELIIELQQYIPKQETAKPLIFESLPKPSGVKKTYQCQHCGRATFTRKQAHNCGNNFRKRGLLFKELVTNNEP